MARKLILLIDYEVSVRTILQICLNRLGSWDVISAASLSLGIAALDTRIPDAIVLDAPTLEDTAPALIQELRRHSFFKNAPIILISANARWFSPQQLSAMTLAGAIHKPFDPTTLPQQIATILHWPLLEAKPEEQKA